MQQPCSMSPGLRDCTIATIAYVCGAELRQHKAGSDAARLTQQCCESRHLTTRLPGNAHPANAKLVVSSHLLNAKMKDTPSLA